MENIEQHVKIEKQKARELRKSRWWQNKIATQCQCYYCAKSLSRDLVTMDHVVPLSQGGVSSRGNIVPSCKECNNIKKNRTASEWLWDSISDSSLVPIEESHTSHQLADVRE